MVNDFFLMKFPGRINESECERSGDNSLSSLNSGDGSSSSSELRKGHGVALPLGIDSPEESIAKALGESLRSV